MFRTEPALPPTSPHAVPKMSNSSLKRVESALPQNKISHSANPIESTPFFPIAQFRTNSSSVTPAPATLTKHAPRNPIRMNTSTKHHLAPPHQTIATNSYEILYRKTHTAWSYHFSSTNTRRVTPIESHC